MLLRAPKYFIGEPLEVNRFAIEHRLLHIRRPDVGDLKINLLQSNVIVVFQALHRTQQHRRLSHTAAREVAAVLGFDSEDGANAVARIVDFYCAARLAFHRQNNQYHPRWILHVLVDEEIRWRLTLGSDCQVLDHRISQRKARDLYHDETRELINTRFRDLMMEWFPPKVPKETNTFNRHFGVLKGINLNKPMMPMREMEPRPRAHPSRRPNPADFSFTAFMAKFEAEKAAEAKQAEEAKKAGAPDNATAGASPTPASSPCLAAGPAPASPSSAKDSSGGDRLASESPAVAQEVEGEHDEVIEAKVEIPISKEIFLAAIQHNQYLIHRNERLEERDNSRLQEFKDKTDVLDQALREVLQENRALKREIQRLKDERQANPHPFEDQVRAIMVLNLAREREEKAAAGAGSDGASQGGEE